jgi:hypothetical protein
VASAALLGLSLGVPSVAALFSFSPVAADHALAAIATGAASVLWFEAIKRRLAGVSAQT